MGGRGWERAGGEGSPRQHNQAQIAARLTLAHSAQENDAGQGGPDAFNYFSGFLPGPYEGGDEGASDDAMEGQDMPPPSSDQGGGASAAPTGGSAFVAPAPPKRKVSLKAKVQVALVPSNDPSPTSPPPFPRSHPLPLSPSPSAVFGAKNSPLRPAL